MQEIEDNLLDDSDDEAVTISYSRSAHTKCDGVRKRLRKNNKFSNSPDPMELSESENTLTAKTRLIDSPAKIPDGAATDLEVDSETGCRKKHLQSRLCSTSEQERPQQYVYSEIISHGNHPSPAANTSMRAEKFTETAEKKMRLTEGSTSHFKGDKLPLTALL